MAVNRNMHFFNDNIVRCGGRWNEERDFPGSSKKSTISTDSIGKPASTWSEYSTPASCDYNKAGLEDKYCIKALKPDDQV